MSLFEIIPVSFENTWHLRCLALSPFSRDGEADRGCEGKAFLIQRTFARHILYTGAVVGTRVHGESCQSYKTSFHSN